MSVEKQTPAVTKMVSDVARIRALMGGTMAMRRAAKAYLPKFESESEAAYSARLAGSWLFNGTRKTVRDMSGRVFEKSIELGEGTPQSLTEWCKNVDMQGRDLSTFARQVFEDGYQSGISYVLVDAPPRNEVVTVADAQMGGYRPYMVHLRVDDILGWKTEVIANITIISQLRISETVFEQDEKDEFIQVEINQIRVLDRLPIGVRTRIYRKAKGALTWAMFGPATVSEMTEITVIPFYANRTGFWTGAPLLDDLADVNIAHWQSQSDQRHILHFARVPILFAAGRTTDEGPIEISASMAVVASDPTAKLSWVEHSGQAIGAGRQDLKDLEFQMEAHGLQLLITKPSGQSATGEALDAAKETSTLAMTADSLKDTLEQALAWMCAYGGLSDVSLEVVVNKDFGVSMIGAQEVTALLSAVNTGALSKATFLAELARRGVVRRDLDIDLEAEQIETEGGNIVEVSVDGQ